MSREEKLLLENTELKIRLKKCQDQLNEYKGMYNEIINSNFWRLTKPFRYILDRIKAFRKKKVLKPIYAIDLFQLENEKIKIEGWIYWPTYPDANYTIIFTNGLNEYEFELQMINRKDVINKVTVIKKEKCGFEFYAEIYTKGEIDVFIEYGEKDEKERLHIGVVENQESQIDDPSTFLKVYPIHFQGTDFLEFYENYLIGKKRIFTIDQERADIIVPVYNGYVYFEKLFLSIEKAGMPYRLIIVDDKSSDKRVFPYLQEYAKGKDWVVLLQNKENLGFVQSVNRALKLAENHVAIVNTDVELPNMWLPRLLAPIYENERIASTTPFTNSGTICSFPDFCKDNEIFEGLSVNEIDSAFAELFPSYITVPTGVGFCMGMNYKVLQEIGYLDAETFLKGYCEENDWCQRALEAGYHNVHVENLFVYHKHGGSFLSEDKKRYIARNLNLLEDKHPGYSQMVENYCKKDPAKQVRNYVVMKLASHYSASKVTLYFDHNWGGGANSYLEKRIEKEIENGQAAVVVVNDIQKGMYADYYYKTYYGNYALSTRDILMKFIEQIRIDEIVINEIVSFPDLYKMLKLILKIKEKTGAKLVMLLHDFFSVCPSLYLLDKNERYCGIPEETSQCDKCLKEHKNLFNLQYGTMKEWRTEWGIFLKDCDNIIAFSNNTKELFGLAYNINDKIKVIPHQVSDIKPFYRDKKKTETLNIGILGNLIKHKGSDIIVEMLRIIRREKMNIKIILIGPDMEGVGDKDLVVSGKYKREELPYLIRRYDIDIFFIASIWPETFSYTTEEVMKMGLPLAVFNLGAPAERVKKYSKGLIISEISARKALDEIRLFMKEMDESIRKISIEEI